MDRRADRHEAGELADLRIRDADADDMTDSMAPGRAPMLARTAPGYKHGVLWLLLVIALVAIIGLGTLLEAAFWTLLVIAAVVVVVALAIGRVVGR